MKALQHVIRIYANKSATPDTLVKGDLTIMLCLLLNTRETE